MPAVPFGTDVAHVNATPTAEAPRARLSPAGRQRGGRDGRRHAPAEGEDEPPTPERDDGEVLDRVEIAREAPEAEAHPPAGNAPKAAADGAHIDIRV